MLRHGSQHPVVKDRSDYILQDLKACCIAQTGVFGGQNTPKWVDFLQSNPFAGFVFGPLYGAPPVYNWHIRGDFVRFLAS